MPQCLMLSGKKESKNELACTGRAPFQNATHALFVWVNQAYRIVGLVLTRPSFENIKAVSAWTVYLKVLPTSTRGGVRSSDSAPEHSSEPQGVAATAQSLKSPLTSILPLHGPTLFHTQARQPRKLAPWALSGSAASPCKSCDDKSSSGSIL